MIPLFVTCRNPKCGRLRQVRTVSDQRRFKHTLCKRCAGAANLAGTNHHETGRAGGLASGATRREALLERLRGLTSYDAYRLGRIHGWHAGVRKVGERMKRVTAA